MTVTETCACGATFAASDHWASDARKAAAEWREGHKHAEAVGICGHRPEPLGGFPKHLPRPYCVLKAGHEGMHGGGDGAHWGTTTPSGDLVCCQIAIDCLANHPTTTEPEGGER
jgi:hypothetical protein